MTMTIVTPTAQMAMIEHCLTMFRRFAGFKKFGTNDPAIKNAAAYSIAYSHFRYFPGIFKSQAPHFVGKEISLRDLSLL
jgi:hypothetical protein